MSESIKVRTIRLAHHFKKDKINVTHVEKPYGEYSDPIVKIEIVEADKIVGHLEVPYENVDELILALRKSVDVCEKIPHSHIHDELVADVGGGA